MASRYRILFTIPNFITAGSGREMLNIIEHLDPELYAPTVGVLHRGGALETEVERLGIPLIEAPFAIPMAPLSTLPPRAWKAAQNFRPYNFDLWHSFHWSSDYTEPIIARLAGTRAWVYTKKNTGWGRRAWHLRSLMASRIVARNHNMLEWFFANRWYRPKTRLVHGGADIIRFSPQVTPHLHLREQLGIASDEIVVACIAQLVPVKDHPTLLRAIALVDGVRLWLAGKPLDKAYVEDLCLLIEELNLSKRVHLMGHITDLPGLLAEADIFALTTHPPGEGCPVALIEAMASGKCCVATDVSGSRDLIQDQCSGVLVEPQNPQALADALVELINSPKKRKLFGEEARKRTEVEFNLEKEAANMQTVYQELLYPKSWRQQSNIARVLKAKLTRQ